MELLVKKASLTLFLREQYEHYEKQVIEEVAKNPQLRESLEKAADTSMKLKALDEEISSDPNVVQLREVIASASRSELTIDDIIKALPFPADVLIRASSIVSKAIAQILIGK